MSDCLEWDKAVNEHGYGIKKYRGKRELAHRVAYAEAKGYPLIDLEGWSILHSCDNPPCINPEHLTCGTQIDNMKDRTSKGRTWSKLTEEEVLKIRSSFRTQKALAKEFGITQQLVSQIKNRKIWGHI